MRKIIYVKSQNSGALSAEDWDLLEHLLRFTTLGRGKAGEDPVTFIHFLYAPNTIEVKLEFMD